MNKRYPEYDPNDNLRWDEETYSCREQTFEEYTDEWSQFLRSSIWTSIRNNEYDFKKMRPKHRIKLNEQKLLEYRAKVVMIEKCIAVQHTTYYSDLVFGLCDESLDSLSQTLYWIESKPFLVT
jgi:hypothetical protein